MSAHKRGIQHVCVIASAIAILLALGLDARAQTASVTGSVRLPDPSLRGDPPERNRGFMQRMSNPIIAPRKYDPLPWLVVTLKPLNELSDAQKAPPKAPATYTLIGEAFATPLFAVAVGSEVSIKNKSTHSRRLYSPTDAGLLAGDTINPNGDRIAKISTPYQVLEIRAKESPHLVGRIVGLPLRYISQVKRDGSFTIPDVPHGKWQVRLWYRNGWLKHKKQTITVSRRGAKVTVVMPSVIELDVPGADVEGK